MIVMFDKAPTANDTIQFEIETTSNGLLENPISIDRIIIYHIEIKPGRDGRNYSIKSNFHDPILKNKFANLQKDTSNNPTKKSIENLKNLKQQLETPVAITYHFSEASPVMIIGNRDISAWKPDIETNIKKIGKGKFQFQWDATGNCDGNYVIVWEWRTEKELLHAYKTFQIHVDRQPLTADSTHYTVDGKYKMLLDLYTPSMYKKRIKTNDLTPEIINKLNSSVAQGFTILEDLANQLSGMLDASLTQKSILPLLANFFGLKLRSNNPNRWRGQIKRAIQLYKRKGTLIGLYEALNHAGIRLTKLTKLWQVNSDYIQTDVFIAKDSEVSATLGLLSKPHISIESVKIKNKNEFLDVPIDCITILPPAEPIDSHTVVWLGHTQENPIELFTNDIVLVNYKIKKIPSEQQAIEDYIQSLPLSDDRPDTTPTKNWNVRLIEEDDPLFDLIIPSRYPFVPVVSYGKVRTKFLYSEQVYNMDTYNGSLRDSFSPCDLDNTFYDQCTACQSSQFNVDLEIEDLSEERIQEAKEIIKEYSPFHARLHYINIAGAVNEFVLPPQENIECLVQVGVPKQLTEVKQAEAIDYVIEWADGSKEKNKVKE